uniref:uncharacterized protein LOC124054980 isoform X1 n=1 Tax=Scatophagus argus TaxID=75038 RepID=UPI001ED83B90|nr:uncharacterized protein LOC124054980 isoform X1 [Scatophagus argus]
MMSFTLVASILYSLSWISVSLSEYQTVEAQPGEEVTLRITNMTKYDTATFWFRLVNRTNTSCISIMLKTTVELCDGYDSRRFEMSSDISTVSLKIKHVDSSDSGLYLCGFYNSGKPHFSVIRLNVKGSDEPHDDVISKCTIESNGVAKMTSAILGGLTVCLLMVIIVLVVQNRKLQTADKEDHNPQQSENVSCDELNYAAVTFRPKAKRRAPEPNVVYAATR